MSQLRLDPLTGRWVVVSTQRADRPSAFLSRSLPVESGPARPCPFCAGNEEATPPALETYGPSGHWRVRVVPNLYPAFRGADAMVVTHLGPAFTQAPASGIHEVLVLSPDHHAGWGDLEDSQSDLVMAAIRDRVDSHSRSGALRYTQVIVNSGREAGASIAHPHGQLLGMPFVPRELVDEQAGFARFSGSCLLCTTIDAEEDAGLRVVYSDDQVVVICPFWSSLPFEMLIMPRHHDAHLNDSSDADLAGVGRAIRDVLGRLGDRLGDPAYNLVFHSAPYRASGSFHWHAHLMPKLTTAAAFEMGTGVPINVVAPEEAADALRATADLTP